MAASPPDRAKASGIATVLRVTSGNFLEMFDFFLFGFYATYISKAFFPAGSDFASLMLTFMTFGAGFLMRPLGAVILGAYVDRIGRRKGLILTLAIMASGTMLIALVPGYTTIGLLAPALGYLLSVTLTPPEIGAWGWRIPFLIGCMIVPFLFYIRRSLEETQEFLARRRRPGTAEIFASIIQNWTIVVLGMMLVVMAATQSCAIKRRRLANRLAG